MKIEKIENIPYAVFMPTVPLIKYTLKNYDRYVDVLFMDDNGRPFELFRISPSEIEDALQAKLDKATEALETIFKAYDTETNNQACEMYLYAKDALAEINGGEE